jgi:hypothetical protein
MAASAYYTQVQNLYVAYFGRPADKLGLEYYANLLDASKGNQTAMLHDFAASAESAALYNQTTTSGKIAAMYQTLFGHAADIDGLAYWVNQVQTGKVIMSEVAATLAFSAQTADAAIVAAKLTAAAAFTAKITTVDQLLAYENNASVGRTWLATVTSTATATTAAATIDSTLAGAVTGGSVAPGSTFTLTTGTDNITGTSNNDTVIGAQTTYSDAAAPALTGTFTVLDNIALGAGTSDTLNLAIDGGGAVAYTTGAIAAANVTGVEVLNIRALQAEAADIVTLAAGTISGLTAVNADRATSVVTVTGLSSTATAGMIGNGSVVNGAFNAGWAGSATTATLNVSGGTTGGNVALTGSGVTSTVINSTGTAANTIGTLGAPATSTSLKINADVGLTTGAITAAGATSITVTGAAATGTTTTVAGEATSAVRIGTAPATVTTIDASGMTAGGVAVTLTAAVASFKGGAGNDAVTTAALTSATASIIDAGAGTADVITVASATHVDTAVEAKQYANFEVLDVVATTLDTSLFTNSTINALKVGGNATLTNMSAAQAAAVTVYANAAASFGVTGAATVGQLDTLSLTVSDGLSATNTLTLGNITAAGVETINLVATDNITVSSLTGAAAMTNMGITGSKAVSVTTGALALNVNTIIDASAATGAVTIDATNGTANGVAIKGTTGVAVNTLTGTGQADTITGGAGNDILSGLAGNDTINAGAGDDAITGGLGVDAVNVGTGVDTIKFTTAVDTLEGVLATGASLATADIYTGMGQGDKIDLATLANLVLADAAITVGTTFATASANLVTIVSGSYDTTTKLFTAGAASTTNNDYLLQYNGGTTATTVNSALLVDIVGTVTAASVGEIITLSVV